MRRSFFHKKAGNTAYPADVLGAVRKCSGDTNAKQYKRGNNGLCGL